MTVLPSGITRITFDANGVPRIRDTGIPVWQIASQAYSQTSPDQLLATDPLLQAEDIPEITAYRITELQELIRLLGHDSLSQINSIFGFAEMANRGMIEAHEEHDLITNVFRGNAQTLLNLLKFAGYIVNGTSDRLGSYERFRFPMRAKEFARGTIRAAEQNCAVTFELDDKGLEDDPLILSDDGLQAAVSELLRLAWFTRRFDNACALILSASDDGGLRLTAQRRLKQPGNLLFLTEWSLSPIPIAAYVLEQRGGSLTCATNEDTITFTINIPLSNEKMG